MMVVMMAGNAVGHSVNDGLGGSIASDCVRSLSDGRSHLDELIVGDVGRCGRGLNGQTGRSRRSLKSKAGHCRIRHYNVIRNLADGKELRILASVQVAPYLISIPQTPATERRRQGLVNVHPEATLGTKA